MNSEDCISFLSSFLSLTPCTVRHYHYQAKRKMEQREGKYSTMININYKERKRKKEMLWERVLNLSLY